MNHHRVAAGVVVLAAVVYLWPFVPRGWVPHDEGMIGQSADFVLHGATPHVDYVEPYTGGLAYLYAAVFRIAGVDLLNVRRLLFAGAAATAWLVYALARRRLAPLAAALATWVAIGWSFPIYFAGLPSWWLLVCAMVALWAMVRWAETRRIRYLVLAGAAAGVAVVIKQTGVYLAIAVCVWALYDGGARRAAVGSALDATARWTLGAVGLLFAAGVLAERLAAPEGIYLFAPAAATAVVLFAPRRPQHAMIGGPSAARLALLAGGVACVPLAALLIPYVRYHHVAEFINGTVGLPQKRLASAVMPMPGGRAIATGVPLVVLIGAAGMPWTRQSRTVAALLWITAVALPLAAVRSGLAYQLTWQAARAFAAMIPIVIAWMLLSNRIDDPRQRSILFAAAAVLAWTSLNQYPFAAAIYFCYTAPVVVVGAIMTAAAVSRRYTRVLLPAAVMFGAFGIAIADRGDLYTLGQSSAPVRLATPLDLPRAHLLVGDRDAAIYRYIVASIGQHLRGGTLIARPDCPEIYFLAGLRNPSGVLYDFFSDYRSDDPSGWMQGDVIVINHQPEFSAAPSDAAVAVLRREFVNGDAIGRFEIRWR